ncbi:hypothetical protein Tco_0295491 [Tanacetum coccineum]
MQIFHAVINQVRVDYANLLWWDFIHCVQRKKDVIQYHCFTKLIITNIIKKFDSIPKRLEEEYHSIKDDTPLVSVYTTRNVTVRGMLILDGLLTDVIRGHLEPLGHLTLLMLFKKRRGNDLLERQVYLNHLSRNALGNRNLPPLFHLTSDDQECDEIHEATLLSLALHKTSKAAKEQENVAAVEKKILEEDVENIIEGEDEESDATDFDNSVFLNDEEDFDTRLEPGSHKENLKNIDDEEEEKKDDKKNDNDDDDDDNHTEHAINFTTRGIKEKVDEVLHEIVPKIASNATNDLIDENLPRIVANAVKKERESLKDVNTVLNVHPTISASITTTTTCDLQYQLYLKMKTDLQAQVADPELWDVLRAKFKKSSASADWDAWVDVQVIDENEVILEVETPELINEFQNIDKRIPTIFDRERMEATLRDMLSNQIRDAKKICLSFGTIYVNTKEKRYVHSLHKIHVVPFLGEDLEERMNRWINHKKVRDDPEEYFSDHKIIKVVRVATKQQCRLDFMEQIIVMRENDKLDSFSEVDFKYLNKNDIKDMYYLCLNKKVNYHENKLLNSLLTFIRSRVIWERVHDFQLGIESYHIKINLTSPILIFPGIEACDPYSIVDEPRLGLMYLNNKERVIDLVKIIKFCDGMLEKVLKELKLNIFETKFIKKAPLLGDLDLKIMKMYEREITKRLRHREQMRRWESLVNGRPILPMMKVHDQKFNQNLLIPFGEPERVFHSTRKLFKTSSLDYSSSPEFNLFSDLKDHIKEEVAESMGEPTMEEYITKTRDDYKSGITRPKFDEKAHFKLKGQFLKEIHDNTFSGSDNEDANEHIENVLEIEVILFYKGLYVPTRQIFDSKGAIPSMKATDAKKAIQDMAD